MIEKEKFERSVLNNFVLKTGHLATIPSQKKKKLIILELLIKKFDEKEMYKEQDVNRILKECHEDFCTLRREMIINGFMVRKENIYQIEPSKNWVDWREM